MTVKDLSNVTRKRFLHVLKYIQPNCNKSGGPTEYHNLTFSSAYFQIHDVKQVTLNTSLSFRQTAILNTLISSAIIRNLELTNKLNTVRK